MESNVLNRVFALSNNARANGPVPDTAASCLRQLKQHAANPAAAAGSIAALLGKLEPAQQEQVVAALEALAK